MQPETQNPSDSPIDPGAVPASATAPTVPQTQRTQISALQEMPSAVPPQVIPSDGRARKLPFFVLGVVIIGMLAGGIYLAKKASTGLSQLQEEKQAAVEHKEQTYISERDITALADAIEPATTLHELEQSLNTTYAQIYEQHGIPQVAPEIAMTADFFEKDLRALVATPGIEYITEADLPLAKEALETFVREYARYPLALQEDVLLRDFWIMQYKGTSDVDVAGTASSLISLSLDSLTGDASSRASLTLHHELWHSIDKNRFVAEVFRSGESDADIVNEAVFGAWIDTNKKGVAAYTNASVKAGDLKALHPAEGFVSNYARVSYREDRAETFAHLMAQRHNNIMNWTKDDAVLASKVAKINEILSEYGIDAQQDLYNR